MHEQPPARRRGAAWAILWFAAGTFLLATLMTARQPSAADLPAAEAARAVANDRPEWASLQFYAARVLRAQGRAADGRAALDALAASTVVHKRDRPLVEAERRGS